MTNRTEGSVQGRFMVTGGSGFIGTSVVEKLVQENCVVRSVDIQPPRNAAHTPYWLEGDILDANGLRDEIAAFEPTVVIHLAATTVLNERTDLHFYAANIDGVQNVIDAVSATATVQRTIFASSRLVNRLGYVPRGDEDFNPSTLYGTSKMLGEQLVRAASDDFGTWIIVRPTGIWGPWFGVPFRDFFLTIRRGRYVHPSGKNALKSFGYVENTVHQLLQLARLPSARVHRRTFVLADYHPVSVRDWATLIQKSFGAQPIRSFPIPLLKLAALAGDAATRIGWSRVPLTSFRLDNLTRDMVYDMTALEALVGPLPHTVAEGVERTVAWLGSHEPAET